MDENQTAGWQLWRSSDNGVPGQWYATRTGQLPDNPPEGFAMTVWGQTEGDLQTAIACQVTMDRGRCPR